MQAIEPETIERAFAAIEKSKLVENGKVSSEMMGYVSSFGAAVIQAGLVAAVIFFSEASSKGDAKDRPKLIKALFHMLTAQNEPPTDTENNEQKPESPAANTSDRAPKDLLDYIRANLQQLDRIEEQILENAVALKLALRSYEIIKPNPVNPTTA